MIDAARSYFDRYLAIEPEEATTLGVHAHDARLKDWSEAGRGDDLAFHRRALAEIDAVRDPLDRWMIERLSRFVVHAYEDLAAHESNAILSVHPHAIVRMQGVQPAADRDVVRARAGAVPSFLAQQEENLLAGVARPGARGPDRTILRQIVEEQLPAAARTFEALGAHDAAAAYARHAERLARDVLPRARDTWCLGEEEYAWRLAHTLAIAAPIAELRASLEATLAESLVAFRASGARLDARAPAAELLSRVAGARPADADDAVAIYRAPLERAARFARERRLYDVPTDYVLLFPPIPDGWSPGAYATNWPAPLLDDDARGGFLVARDPALHSVPWATNLALHEGIPGHYLQSLAWQRSFGRTRDHLVRFLLVADDVAMVRQDYGPMLAIEGWAVWAEETMLDAGFFEGRPEEELCARASRVIRAARALADLDLHTARRSPDAAAARFAETTGMSAGFARSQVLRYMRIPMQALTYAVGCDRIRALRAARGSAEPLSDFHAWLLSQGPVPPSVLLARTESAA